MKDICISPDSTVVEALKTLDNTAEKVLLVVDASKTLLGTLTDGDVRRAILAGVSLQSPIEDVYNKTPIKFVEDDWDEAMFKQLTLSHNLSLVPLVDRNNKVTGYKTLKSVFKQHTTSYPAIELPVVIMAGGKGTRLLPFTKIIPKPLIPINDKCMLDHVMESFRKYNVPSFYISVNYKGDMIKAYLDSQKRTGYTVEYVEEQDFYGTAGSLSLLKGKINSPFILSNCDILVRADLSKVVEFHTHKKSALTIVSSIQHVRIPYGVIDTEKEGKVTSILEKPEHSIPVNTSVCVVDPKVLTYIDDNQYLDMNQLIERLIENGESVYSFPINEKEFMDFGQWEEYKASVGRITDFIDDV